jgi:DNA modification methylase
MSKKNQNNNSIFGIQLSLFENERKLGKHGTFIHSHKEIVHRWYPYIEGFSSEFAKSIIDDFCIGNRVYDPFAGTGTTVNVAASLGLSAFYSEINPFMRLVIECKTNGLKTMKNQANIFLEYMDKIENYARNHLPTLDCAQNIIEQAFGNSIYFKESRLVEIIALKQAIAECEFPCLRCKDFANLALGSIAVSCSEMKRASDLRYRKINEQLPEDFSVFNIFSQKKQEIYADLIQDHSDFIDVICLGESALIDCLIDNKIDLVLTSPPYLNGTNYFRNTKLELWLTNFIQSKKDLDFFRTEALAAGINNISKRGRQPIIIPEVEEVAYILEKVTYDPRIPELVRRYFSDSCLWIQKIYNLLRPGGMAVIDIGDSRFAGIHIATDQFLKLIASQQGFYCHEERFVRSRKSKDGTDLKQVLLILEKTNPNSAYVKFNPSNDQNINQPNNNEYKILAEKFAHSLPHLTKPYSSRNWGHTLHSLCSYQGKLKPAIAHFLIKEFTSPGDSVLDPMSGCGTIPLESLLQGRYPLGNDLQELGYILTKAKVERGTNDEAYIILDNLLKYVDIHKNQQNLSTYAHFGFNGKLPEYFHEETLKEILAARNYLQLYPCTSWGQSLVYSSLLHILHGNRPYALSRRSHPVTPFKPSGNLDYRPLEPRLKAKVERMLQLEVPKNLQCGMATQVPFSQLDYLYQNTVDVVITSPPFAASTRFSIANWMRLWFAGWEPGDFKSRQEQFLEYQQRKSMDVYVDFFDSAAKWLKPGGRLIMHVGRTASCNMAEELIKRSGEHFKLIYSFDEDILGREKFGIRDQGATQSHQYIFLQKND